MTIKAKRKSLSYEELTRMNPEKLEELAMAGMLDDETHARIEHLGRFFGRLSEMGPADMKVGDVVTEEEAQIIWRETADKGATEAKIGRCPLIH
jgi:hypothetical protein